jgi:hypothetical protein
MSKILYVFRANFSCFIGVRAIVKGEILEAVEDANGQYCLHFENEIEPFIHLDREEINKLAGEELIKCGSI